MKDRNCTRRLELIAAVLPLYVTTYFFSTPCRGGRIYTDILTGPDQVLGQNHAISNIFESMSVFMVWTKLKYVPPPLPCSLDLILKPSTKEQFRDCVKCKTIFLVLHLEAASSDLR
jgi:hypothetical protein